MGSAVPVAALIVPVTTPISRLVSMGIALNIDLASHNEGATADALRPSAARINVVLPAPLEPSMSTNSPVSIKKLAAQQF